MHKKIEDILRMVQGRIVGTLEGESLWIDSVSTDTRTLSPGALFVPLEGERFDGHAFVPEAFSKGAAASFWREGREVPESLRGKPLLFVADPLQAMQEMASAYRQEVDPFLIAITGSNGKTTTKDLITSLLRTRFRVHATSGNLNNHIGLPLTLLEIPEESEIAVVELGMNHFGELEALSKMARPDIAVITNIGESHMAFLGSRQGIALAKTEILSGMDEEGLLFYPIDEPLIPASPLFIDFRGRKIPCGFTENARVKGEIIEDLGLDGFLLRLTFDAFANRAGKSSSPFEMKLPIPGRHLAQNALYALAIATYLGLTTSEMDKGLSSLTMSGMRMQIERGVHGVTLIHDAYNASPTSMMAALRFLAGLKGFSNKIAILGDMGELGEEAPAMHRQIGRQLAALHLSHVFVTGTLAEGYVEGAKEEGYPSITHYHDGEALIREALRFATPDTVILLKASRFMHFEEIGKAFLPDKMED